MHEPTDVDAVDRVLELLGPHVRRHGTSVVISRIGAERLIGVIASADAMADRADAALERFTRIIGAADTMADAIEPMEQGDSPRLAYEAMERYREARRA